VAAGSSSRIDGVARRAALRVLAELSGGRLTVADADGVHVVGHGTQLDPSVTVRVHSPSAYRALLRGSRGIAESYAEGHWDCDDLVGLVRIAARWLRSVDPWRQRVARVIGPFERIAATRRANTRTRSVDNILRHYDLGNEFFSLVLDETMGYSCAYYERPGVQPVEASRANLDRVCRILDLRPGDRVLEMGSGWGGLALHAALHYGCRVSAVTISPSQRKYIDAAASKAGVADRVDVLMRDYRDVRGTWDKLVSLEMVESIGALHLDTFIAQCGRLIRADGLMLIQAITTTDKLFRIDRYHRTFLNELIFPGGCVPSLEAITGAAGRRTDLRVTAVYDISAHYPPTLRAWRERLQRNWSRIQALGDFDERFRRLWTLYMSWCEAGFIERRVQDRQIVLAGPLWREENRILGLPLAEPAAEPAQRTTVPEAVTAAG
jgi:cyclopropane-fatty-acyl-phospholipid synthase